MKRILITLAFILSAFSIYAVDITPVADAFKTGNAELLTGKMSTTVDIAVPGTSINVPESSAIAILKTFFEDNKPTNFKVVHHANKNDSGFFVGKLTTDGNEFRVNVTYIVKDEKLLIQLIRIE